MLNQNIKLIKQYNPSPWVKYALHEIFAIPEIYEIRESEIHHNHYNYKVDIIKFDELQKCPGKATKKSNYKRKNRLDKI